jgi:hypothetical protein
LLEALEWMVWVQRRNHQAMLSHRKRTLAMEPVETSYIAL